MADSREVVRYINTERGLVVVESGSEIHVVGAIEAVPKFPDESPSPKEPTEIWRTTIPAERGEDAKDDDPEAKQN